MCYIVTKIPPRRGKKSSKGMNLAIQITIRRYIVTHIVTKV